MKSKQSLPRTQSFIIRQHGKETISIDVHLPFGFFIKETRKARSFRDLNKIIEHGLSYQSVQPLMHFLDLTTKEIAELTGVSTRTVSRWDNESVIGSLPSKNLIKIDALVRKGIDVFGSEENFKTWLQQPNISLGDEKPIELLSTPYGVELVEDTLESLEYGNVM